MTCSEIREVASDYLERAHGTSAMSETLLQRVERHLKVCPGCLAFMKSLQQTIAMLGQLPRARTPDSLRQRLLDQTRKQS